MTEQLKIFGAENHRAGVLAAIAGYQAGRKRGKVAKTPCPDYQQQENASHSKRKRM